MSPTTKFESVQKRDAPEFIPMVARLGLKSRFKKSEMHGDLPFGYCGKCIKSAEEGRYISTQKKRR
jgi:hypothetical protein